MNLSSLSKTLGSIFKLVDIYFAEECYLENNSPKHLNTKRDLVRATTATQTHDKAKRKTASNELLFVLVGLFILTDSISL